MFQYISVFVYLYLFHHYGGRGPSCWNLFLFTKIIVLFISAKCTKLGTYYICIYINIHRERETERFSFVVDIAFEIVAGN